MTHLIFCSTSIDCGGAESLLLNLVKELDNKYKIIIIYIIGKGTYKSELKSTGAEVFKLNPSSLFRTINLLYKNPDTILQGWMYHGNMLATLLYLLTLGRGKLFWTIHHSAENYVHESLKHFLILKFTALLSRLPKAIVFVSEFIKKEHISYGYKNNHMQVIYNGIDTSLFKRNEEAAKKLIYSLNIPSEAIIMGTVGRNHPVKDYRTFFRSSSLLIKKHPNLHIIVAGRDVNLSQFSNELRDLTSEQLNRIHLLGERKDIPEILSLIDIFVLTSISESFSISLIEALAAGCCCVTTNVIFYYNLFPEALTVFPPYDYQSLVKCVEKYIYMSQEQRNKIGKEASLLVEQYFPLSKTINNYRELWDSVQLRN